ncbi:MAG: hypothetical protein OXB93_00945 [Cytophagales bacterium]|nr:hypothetical protein [Cytophagales bacterium]
MSFFSQLRNAILGPDGVLSKAELFSAICIVCFLIAFGLSIWKWFHGDETHKDFLIYAPWFVGYILGKSVSQTHKKD